MSSSSPTTISHNSVSLNKYSVSSPSRQFQANQEFTINPLDLPRIVVPPPSVDFEDGKNIFKVQHAVSCKYSSTKYGNPVFLRSISTTFLLELSHRMLAWTYEERRNTQQILPYLLLGPGNSARDVKFIADNNITMLVAVRSAAAAQKHPCMLNPVKFKSATGRQTLTFDIDTPYEFITRLGPTIRAMNDHLEQHTCVVPITKMEDVHGKIMVFCETGNERSTALVTAYLMVIYGLDAITAIQVVQSQRFCINIDDAMKNMLLDFEALMKAERDVAQSEVEANHLPHQTVQQISSSTGTSFNPPTKRSIDAAYDSDEEMAYDDYIDIGFRGGSAPFIDMTA